MPNKETTALVRQLITQHMGLPFRFKMTHWTQKGNGGKQWAFHRGDLTSHKKRTPESHTTHFAIKKSVADDEYRFGIFTSHSRDELINLLAAIEGGPRAAVGEMFRKLKRLGYGLYIHNARDGEDIEIASQKQASDALSYVKKKNVPWYSDIECYIGATDVHRTTFWNRTFSKGFETLRSIFWMHAHGKNYWAKEKKPRTFASGKRAHTNTRNRKQLIEANGAGCQNVDCRAKTKTTHVAHLHPGHKHRDKIDNVILLCPNCHADQKPRSICKPEKIRTNKKGANFRVTFESRSSEGRRGEWKIRSAIPLKAYR